MRLLKQDSGAFSLTKDFTGDDAVPLYAILSHTWGADDDEVTFHDLTNGLGGTKLGYAKLDFCANKARRHGLIYFWIDTCCIDKSNSTELNEAINSMFRWYKNAARCFVYLNDVSTADSTMSWESAFRASRWFTRGWTLQELLAPAVVEFYSKEGSFIGDKASLKQQISETTSIAPSALSGSPLALFTIEERFSWAEWRKTKREEDWAYSLLGIFGVFIPIIYGEGKENAKRRLRSELQGGHHRARRVIDVPVDVNKNYVTRQGEEGKLQEALQPGKNTAARAALWGLGGSGKTQLALRFVIQHQKSYPFIFWLNGDSWTKLLSGFSRMLRLAGETSVAGSDMAEQASEWLRSNSGWMLVIDNIDDAAVLHRLHDEVLRAGMDGSVLLTSRNDEVSEQWHLIEVSKMTDAESTALVAAIAGSENARDDATATLLNDLGHLPLAVDQAASYIHASRITVAKYHELYKRAKTRYLEMYPSTRYNVVGRHNVMTTWNLSFNEIAKTHPQAATLLLLISLLESDDVPVSILKSCAHGQYYWTSGGTFEPVPAGQGWIPEDLAEVLESEPALVESQRELQRFGFVRYQSKRDSLHIHPLVQYWALQRLEKESQPALRQRLVVCLLGLVSSVFEKQDRLPALPPWFDWSSASYSVEERKLDVWPWRKYPRLITHAQRGIRLATKDLILGAWRLGSTLTMAHISLPLLQVLEYSSFGRMSLDYWNAIGLIDACLLACTQNLQAPDNDTSFPMWAAAIWRQRRSSLCACRTKLGVMGSSSNLKPEETLELLKSSRNSGSDRESPEPMSRRPSRDNELFQPCRICQETSETALYMSVAWPTTPNTRNPFRTQLWIHRYWDTTERYFCVRAKASDRLAPNESLGSLYGRGGFFRDVFPASARGVRDSFGALCGNLSEEYRRASYFLVLELGALSDGHGSGEIISILEPLVAASIASPEASWSHERCITEYIKALVDTSRESDARDCLQKVEIAYEKAGLSIPRICRGGSLLKRIVEDPNKQLRMKRIQVFVKTMTGRIDTVQTTPFASVEELFRQIEKGYHWEYRHRHYRLLFGGRQLEPRRLLSDYNIQDGSTLDLVMRLQGGVHGCDEAGFPANEITGP